MLYFDHSATTQPSSQALETFNQVALNFYANPSSLHSVGEEAAGLLKASRQQIASILSFETDEIYFTSSGTESNNWVLQKLLPHRQTIHPNRNQVIISGLEHPSITAQIPFLKTLGLEVVVAAVDEKGKIKLDELEGLLSEKVLMLSTMAVNNEMGAVQPFKELAGLLKGYPQILWHVDGVQAVTSQLALLNESRIDLLTLSSHKFHSVKGVGILAVRERVPKVPLLYGGGQENGWRSSTENLPAIVAASKALRLAFEGQAASKQKLASFHFKIRNLLEEQGWILFGDQTQSEHIICAALPPVPGEVMVHAFSNKNIMISTTSACSSRVKDQHHTLQAMGVEDRIARSAVRISMSQITESEEVEALCQAIKLITANFKADFKGV